MNDRAGSKRDSEMYSGDADAATSTEASARLSFRSRGLLAGEGAALGVATWVLLLTFGVPWALHIEGFDGLIPCAIVGALLSWFGWRIVPIAVVAALSLVLTIVAFTPIVVGPVESLVRRDPLPAHADAVMVLSAGINDDGTLSPDATDRLLKGIELVNRGVAPWLVVSREAYIINGHIVTSREDQERIVSLTKMGLSKLMVAGITHSTHDEAIRARALMRANGWSRMVLVTSPLHTRRACRTFEKAGVPVSCEPSNTRAFALGAMFGPMDRVRAFQVWFYETAGTIRYRQLGWI